MRICTAEFTSSGSWVAPAGVTSVIVYGQGGGGGGASGALIASAARYGGGGGVATFLTAKPLTVVPNTSYTVTIGAGGLGSTDTTGNDIIYGGSGGDTTFGVLATFGGAKGGQPGSLFGGNIFSVLGFNARPTTYPSSNPIFANSMSLSNTIVAPSSATCWGAATPNGTYGVENNPGMGGNPSDAGLGGPGGNSAVAMTSAATDGSNAPGTSYGSGGGGGGTAATGYPTPGIGGNGTGGRLIVVWME